MFLVACQQQKNAASNSDQNISYSKNEFLSSSTVEEIQGQLRKLPKDNIWWTVSGEDMKWNNKNLHQIFPTVNVYRNGPMKPLEKNLMNEINISQINTPNGPMTFESFIESDQSTVMGVVIAHKGKIVFESYPRMQEHEKPIYWSVSKILPATVLRILEERGEVDVSRTIDSYIKELSDSSYAGITIRNILDMASGLDCSDNYETFESCYYLYSMSIGDGFRTEAAEDNPYDFVINTKIDREVPQGEVFSYSGLDTFVLGWLVEEITKMPFQDALSKEVWYHIGAESDASYIAPRYGIAITHGGFLAKMRDMVRLGLLFTPSYQTVSDKQIISNSHIDLILNGGNPKLMQNLYSKVNFQGVSASAEAVPGIMAISPLNVSDVKHNVYQWDAVYENNDFFKGGWAGQGLLINPTRDIVAVWTGYKRNDAHDAREMRTIVREVLNNVFGNFQ
jgi:CubicO group peptidase (beta-lactamase class C family)